MAETYIVECAICGQPWEVPQPLMTVPPRIYIVIPDHEMLSFKDSTPQGFSCLGSQTPGFGLGERRQWEQRWPLRRMLRPLPSVLDGAHAVQVLQT